MKELFQKPLLYYTLWIIATLLGAALILNLVAENIIFFILVLGLECFILLFLVHRLYRHYIKPTKKASNTIERLTEGKYDTRFHDDSNEIIGNLSRQINLLARELNDRFLEQQTQSNQLATVINNTESGLILINEKGYIQLVNRKFVSMFGSTSKDYNGYLYTDVIENEIIHKVVKKTFLYEKNIKEASTHYIGLNKYYYEIAGAPIFKEGNKLSGAVLVIYDITDMKQLELMRKDFVANVSHELKTPITSIKGFAETLLDNDSNKKMENEFLTIIYNESDRLQILIQDLLKLSKLEKEDFQLVLNKIHAQDMLKEIMPAIKVKAENAGIELFLHVAENLEFKADKDRVKQILINLLDNAINYTPEYGKVSLTIEKEDGYIHMLVADTGIGMKEKHVKRVFERFYRVDKARSRDTGGTGLGLAIVKHIVEVHEGEIQVDSEPDKGTHINVYLPDLV